MNSKRIKLFCTNMQDKYVLDAEGYMRSMPLPAPSASLEVSMRGYINSTLEAFAAEIMSILPEKDIASYKNSLKKALKHLEDSVQLKNEKAVDTLFENCIATARDVFSSKVTLTSFLSDSQFERFKKAGVDAAFEVFDFECRNFSSEKAYGLYEAKLKVIMSEFIEQIKNENDLLVQKHMAETVKAFLSKFEEKTGPDGMPLPMNTSELDLSLKREQSIAESQFAVALEDFHTSPYYSQFFKELKLQLSKKADERQKENVKAFAQVVDGPLSKARQIILLSAHNYRTEFGLRSYIMQVCLVQLQDGKAKHWNEDLKKSIIVDFMHADPDLAKALVDVKGLWSSLLGFFLWLFWILGIKL